MRYSPIDYFNMQLTLHLISFTNFVRCTSHNPYGVISLKRNYKRFTYYLTSIGVSFLVLSGFVSNSPTSGLKIIFASLLFIGILFLVFALVRLYRLK